MILLPLNENQIEALRSVLLNLMSNHPAPNGQVLVQNNTNCLYFLTEIEKLVDATKAPAQEVAQAVNKDKKNILDKIKGDASKNNS